MLAGWRLPVHLVGCGNMGGAILSRWLDAGLSPDLVSVTDPSGRPAPGGVRTTADLPDRLADGSFVLLGFKPQQLGAIAPGLNQRLPGDSVVLSILAGLPLDLLRAALPQAGALVRLMPNLPVATGDGVVLVRPEDGTSSDVVERAGMLLSPLGLVEPLAGEAGFDLGTAVSGCGPAFVYRFIDAMAVAAERLGMDRAQADRLALHTVAGAALSARRAEATPAAMADAVASPGGMTREGMDVLDADDRLIELLTDTLRAARDRGEALRALAVSA